MNKNEFNVGEYVVLDSNTFGKIIKLQQDSETGHTTVYVKTLGSQYVCSVSQLKKVDMDKFKSLLPLCTK